MGDVGLKGAMRHFGAQKKIYQTRSRKVSAR